MIQKLSFQNSYGKAITFIVVQFLIVLFAFVSEAIVTKSLITLTFFFQFILLLVVFNFYYSALAKLFYSFWNMSFLLAFYYVVSIFRNVLVLDNPLIGLMFIVCLFLLGASCYIASSPVYYPRVNWWEYDFRFRADIRCWVEYDGKQFRGRLSDLRREAACLELFTSIGVDQTVQINLEILNQNFVLNAEIKSRRETIAGRALIYGIKFVNTDLEQSQRLKLLTNYWKESKRLKIRSKFANKTHS